MQSRLPETTTSLSFTLTTSTALFPPYKIIDYGDTQIAYIGIDTPESFTKSTPAYFQDEHGNYIYNFCQGNTKNLGGSVGKEYADPYGQERITIVSQSTANAA